LPVVPCQGGATGPRFGEPAGNCPEAPNHTWLAPRIGTLTSRVGLSLVVSRMRTTLGLAATEVRAESGISTPARLPTMNPGALSAMLQGYGVRIGFIVGNLAPTN